MHLPLQCRPSGMLQGSSAHADRIDALQDEDLFDQNVEDYEVYSGGHSPDASQLPLRLQRVR